MITLITGQPGNGKSALTVWQFIRPEVEKRTVYCVGIPKLTLPVIPMSRAELERWHELEPKKNPDDDDEVPLLKNIQEGSLIVVDECQKSFKPTGTTMHPFIEYLCEHRHHGLDFVVITQFPHLVHKTVRALVTKHIHVRSTWRGRSLHEWPEWQENPHTKSNLAVATTTRYTIPKEVFGMYESASIHTKVKHKIPMAFKLFVLLLVVVPMLGYMAVQRVKAKAAPHKADEAQVEQPATVVSQTVQAMTPEQVELEKAKLQEPRETGQPQQVVITKSLRLADSSVLWPAVAGCVEFRGECRCYGDEGERLDVSQEACRSGIEHKWAGRGMPAETTTRRHDEAES
ncbi:zonular occludens toxin domain-containing protein [Methylobacillus sp. Pita1]|uniref:zonular occludens toxin domain-containing protein n=1 Tax=Methylobacillus sp. Pita1 TaxID=3382642 RepID=UPI0038B62E4A